jgi:hypothetical protein
MLNIRKPTEKSKFKSLRGTEQSREGPWWKLTRNFLANKNCKFLLYKHFFGYVVHVGDVGPLVGVGVDALRH